MIQENVLRCGPIVPIGTSDVEASALWNDWGAVQFAQGDVKLSERAFRRALELDDSAREPAINLGLLLLAQKSVDEGLRVIAPHRDTLSDAEKRAILSMAPSLQPEEAIKFAACRVPTLVRTVLTATPVHAQYRIQVGQDVPVLSGFNLDPDWSGWNEGEIGAIDKLLVAAPEAGSIRVSLGLLTVNDNLNGFHVLRKLLYKYQPRVLAVTFNASLGPDADSVVPYLRGARWDGTDYFGASYRAYVALAHQFKYQVVGCDETGAAVFLIRRDLIENGSLPDNTAGYRPGPVYPHDPGNRRYLTSAHYLMDGVGVFASPFGHISYFTNDEYIGSTLARGQYWEAPMVQRMGQVLHAMDGMALDIGAHIGTHAIGVSRLAPRLKFKCFEPQLPLFRLLERNVLENGLGDRIETIWSAVAQTSGEATLSMNASDGTSAGKSFEYGNGAPVNLGGIQLGAGGQICKVTAIDDLHLSDLRYVKIDVEGAESLVLAGMRKTLETSSPVFLYEERADRQLPTEAFDALKADAGQLCSITEYLASRGYSVQRLGLDWLAMPMVGSVRPDTASTYSATIPPRIFQTWKSKVVLPGAFQAWSQTFKDRNPHFIYDLWDDDDNRNFIATEFPWFLNIYNGYRAEIYRADVVRYFYLYTFGGLYADMDTECLRPLDGLLNRADVVLGRMGSDPDFAHSIPNAIMASRPRQEFWLLVIALLLQSSQQAGRPESLTGPVLLKSAVDLYGTGAPALISEAIRAVRNLLRPDQQPEESRSRIEILAGRELYPIDWSDPIHQMLRGEIFKGSTMSQQTKATLFPKAWMVTYWSHSWEPDPTGICLA